MFRRNHRLSRAGKSPWVSSQPPSRLSEAIADSFRMPCVIQVDWRSGVKLNVGKFTIAFMPFTFFYYLSPSLFGKNKV